jgi:hypothetical protein
MCESCLSPSPPRPVVTTDGAPGYMPGGSRRIAAAFIMADAAVIIKARS